MAKKKVSDPNVVSTREAVASALNIPLAHAIALKKLGCEGAPTTGRYYLKEIKAWYDANKSAVEEFCEDDVRNQPKGYWKERKEKALAITAEIHQHTLQNNTLDRDKTIAFLKSVASSQAIILRNMSQDLPHKLLGKGITEIGVELSKSYDQVCLIFKETLDRWQSKK